jgi:hypothetical protein
MDDINQAGGRKRRVFRWPESAKAEVLAKLSVGGRQLHDLITRLAEQSGNPRPACLRFARRLGLKAKTGQRKWSLADLEKLQKALESHQVPRIAVQFGVTPRAIYQKMRRAGLSGRTDKGWLPLFALVRFLHVSPHTVREWIQRGWLEAKTEDRGSKKQLRVSRESLDKFCREHREIFAGRGPWPRYCERLEFIYQYVFLKQPSRVVETMIRNQSRRNGK